MLQAGEVIAFAASADLRRARAFYEQVLGLRVTEQNDFACVMTAWSRTRTVSGRRLAATRWHGSPIRTGTSCRSPSSPSPQVTGIGWMGI